jgi:AhpD family alkylhydroperoxidase
MNKNAAPERLAGFRQVRHYLSTTSLTERLLELVYLRVSQLNRCAYCVDVHGRKLIEAGVPMPQMARVATWRDAGAMFDARERAALAWAESLTRISDGPVPDAARAAVRAAFDGRELADLTAAIGLINALNRVMLGLRDAPIADEP